MPGGPDRRPSGPRRVRRGLRLARRDGVKATNAAARRWLAGMERTFGPEAMRAGWEYALSGQVVTLDLEEGQVRATVQGTAARPYTMSIRFETLPAPQWRRVVEAMAAEAVYAARLLHGELPAALETLEHQLDLQVLPPSQVPWSVDCTCPAAAPCKHAAAVGYLVAERLEERPILAFKLRGADPDRLREQLRQARAMRTRGAAAAHADPLIPESQVTPAPLESCAEDFWRAAPSHAEPIPSVHYPPHGLLRRLGPSPLPGRFPLVGLLATVYDTVAGEAAKLGEAVES
jgi:uncharacterized Zn finger protein